MTGAVPFRRLAGHVVAVPVRAGGSETLFAIDSGIGVTLVTRGWAQRVGARATGASFEGRRMSGQVVRAPTARLPDLTIGGRTFPTPIAAVYDLDRLPDELAPLGGFLGLSLFERNPITVDYPAATVRIEAPGPRPRAPPGEVEVAARPERVGPSVDLYVDLTLPSGRSVSVEVDMGSSDLVLHTRYLAELGIRTEDPEVQTYRGTDETGRAYVRHRATVRGAVHLTHAPAFAQENPVAVFQEIIHDGLLGYSFLRPFRVRFDVARERIGFAPA